MLDRDPRPSGVVAETLERAADEGGEQQVLGRPRGVGVQRRPVLGSKRAAVVEVHGVAKLLRFRGHAGILPSGPARTPWLVIRLRALTEAQCWARGYGSWGSTVKVVPLQPRRPRLPTTVTREAPRR